MIYAIVLQRNPESIIPKIKEQFPANRQLTPCTWLIASSEELDTVIIAHRIGLTGPDRPGEPGKSRNASEAPVLSRATVDCRVPVRSLSGRRSAHRR